jgi:ferredoxin
MANTYTVEISHLDTTTTIEVSDDQTILQAALDAGIDLPNSCNAGVCTTCAAKLSEGKVSQEDGMGLSPDLQKEGYALLCVAYPRANIKLKSSQEDVVYQRQFGKP